MKCPNCDRDLIWGGDVDCEDDEEYAVESNYSCPSCNTLVFVCWPRDDKETV